MANTIDEIANGETRRESRGTLLKIVNLTKGFGSIVANDKISLDIEKGEIHCLLGENGAGKTTLAECIYGTYRSDSGSFYIEGQEASIRSPRDAIQLGIGMVHQHFTLASPLTVVENIIVGSENQPTFLDLETAERRLQELCDSYGITIDLSAQVWNLSVGEQQWVEILKALYREVKLLILDEPTAVLTPQETEKLFAILRKMKAKEISVLFITHKLKEVMEASDRVSVLRKGKKIDTIETKKVTQKSLANLMVGRDVVFRVKKEGTEIGKTILEIQDLHVRSIHSGYALRGVNLKVRTGEIVGVAGVAGNGQKELFESLIGIRTVDLGRIILSGEDITKRNPQSIAAKGIAHIPEDRLKEGLVPDFTVAENLIFGLHKIKFYWKGIYLKKWEVEEFASKCIDEFNIATPSKDQKTKKLSGGNLQKVILARELSLHPKCLIANQPTRGLDVGATEYVHRRLLEQCKKGVGILLFSEDLDEILTLADLVVVIYNGEIMASLADKSATRERIGMFMAGIAESE